MLLRSEAGGSPSDATELRLHVARQAVMCYGVMLPGGIFAALFLDMGIHRNLCCPLASAWPSLVRCFSVRVLAKANWPRLADEASSRKIS